MAKPQNLSQNAPEPLIIEATDEEKSIARNKSESATFFCSGHLSEVPISASSPDPRYCETCYRYLLQEALSNGSTTKTNWVPLVEDEGSTVEDAFIVTGDSVQLDRPDSDIFDCWLPVSAVDTTLMLNGELDTNITVINTNGQQQVYSLGQVIKHKRGTLNMATAVKSPMENLIKCRETLAKMKKEKKSDKAIKLWEAKVAKAEQQCRDEGIDPNPDPANKPKTKKAVKVTEPKPTIECQCGCGQMAKPGRNFLQGHDAKFASMIRKYDAGDLKQKDLPALVIRLIKKNDDLVQKARNHAKPSVKPKAKK